MTLTLPMQRQADDAAAVSALKRAVIYLRVSSAAQVNTTSEVLTFTPSQAQVWPSALATRNPPDTGSPPVGA